jgi:hypothetical protein
MFAPLFKIGRCESQYGSATGDRGGQRGLGLCGTPTKGTWLRSIWRHSAAIQQQLVTVQNDPLLAEFVEKTIAYAEAKTALREAMPELINIATGKESRPVQLEEVSDGVLDSRRKAGKGGGPTETDGYWSAFRAILILKGRGQKLSILRKSKRPFMRILMVSARAKKIVDPAPLCGKSAKIMRSATGREGRRMELYCGNQDGPFPVKS